MSPPPLFKGGGFVALAFVIASALAQPFQPMEFVIPLYIAPRSFDGTIAPQWVTLHDTARTGATVFGILNPSSGPGNETAPYYTESIEYVKGAGAKLICYVATTYGLKSVKDVKNEIDAYQKLYPGACNGIFFDEAPHLLGDMLPIFAAQNAYAHLVFDSEETARVVFNTGQAADPRYFRLSPPAEILGFENYYKTVRQLGFPQAYVDSTPEQNMILLHSATELANDTSLIQPLMNKAYCKGWGTLYVTDDPFVNGNPWDDPPTFWGLLVEAARNIPSENTCGLDGFKVLAPLLGSSPLDFEAVINSASPGDYGDKIIVALDVEITETGASTDRAAAVRDAGAKVLCYIDATNADMATLEDKMTTFTYFPLNEICAGFFFGGFNAVAALRDVDGLRSLYAKTQATFLQAMVVFAPVVPELFREAVFSDDPRDAIRGGKTNFRGVGSDLDGSVSDAFGDADRRAAGSPNGVRPKQGDTVTQSVVLEVSEALVEVLSDALGMDSTSGDVILALTQGASSTIPLAPHPIGKNGAVLLTGYTPSPQPVILELFAKGWNYGYVTDFEDFERLSTQWMAVVEAAKVTDTYV